MPRIHHVPRRMCLWRLNTSIHSFSLTNILEDLVVFVFSGIPTFIFTTLCGWAFSQWNNSLTTVNKKATITSGISTMPMVVAYAMKIAQTQKAKNDSASRSNSLHHNTAFGA